jgi:acyl CoA:acetate/3-ketoacid CoA transferase alpha subunit/acyl CoA:acetate/3-ketoacid CoA transferase beta subunit
MAEFCKLESFKMKRGLNMAGRFNDLVESTFNMKEDEGENKVISLREAIQRNIKPGAKIHIGATHCCSGAAILEIARQFYGGKPGFTLIMRGIRDTATILLHLGLLKKVITSFSGNVYPWYSPNPVCQKAYINKDVELEDWSILTFPLMLMAGAFGTGFMSTTSIVGSSIAAKNTDSFKVIDDPFGSGKKIGLLKALNPDISIIHGVAADREGNTILTPPYSESLWGAKASTGGVVVTAEKLVSTEFIRQHSHLVKVPAYMVKSVSVVPLGAHPGGVWNQGVETFESYAEDYEFMTQFNQTCKDPKSLDAWVQEWVLNCPSFEDYKTKLGRERILSLKGNADRDAWQYQLDALEDKISEKEEYNDVERMVIVASRELKDRILRSQHKTMLAGAGTANLAAWVAKYHLKKENYIVELLVELGYFGNSPRPAEPFLLNFGNFATCKMLTETLDTLGVFTCGDTNRCIGVLGGGQIDKFGNINSNWIADDLYLTGSGGANDVATGARETMVIMQQSRRRFLEKVPFITAPGDKVKILVSTMGVFEKLDGDAEFTLTKYFTGDASSSTEEMIRKIKENCGWNLKVAEKPIKVSPPALEELRLLRVFDPEKYYIK